MTDDLARKRKLVALLLLAVDEAPKNKRLTWDRIIRRACKYGDYLDASPAEFNQLLELKFKELIGGPEQSGAVSPEARAASRARAEITGHLLTHPDHADRYPAGHDFVLRSIADIRREHERLHGELGDHQPGSV